MSRAAFAAAASAGGACKTFKTTPLLTAEEGMNAMRKAGSGTSNRQGRAAGTRWGDLPSLVRMWVTCSFCKRARAEYL